MLKALFVDNPVLEKDATTTLRARAAPFVVGAAGVALWLLALAVHAGVEPDRLGLGSYAPFRTSGRAMFAALAGALLLLETLLVPALASSTVAGERERGTLPLLQVSALSPGRIVAGKVAAVVLVAVPVLAVALPLLALASIYGGVSALDVVAGVAFLAVHGVALAATGVGASSLVSRARVAAPLAMVFSAVPSLLFGIPAAMALVVFGAGEQAAATAPILVVGAVADALVAAASLLLARGRLAPRSSPRAGLRRVVTAGAVAGLPVVAAAALWLFAGPDASTRSGIAAVVFLEAGVLAVAAILYEVCCAGGADAASPRRRALVVTALAAVGLVVARLVPAPPPATPRWSSPFSLGQPTLHDLPWPVIAVLVAQVAFLAALGAFVASRVRPRPLRLVVTGAALAALGFAPFLLHGLRFLLGFSSEWPLGFASPFVVAGTALAGEHVPSLAWAATFAACSTALLLVLCRGRERAG